MLKGGLAKEKVGCFDSEFNGLEVQLRVLLAQCLAMLLGFLFAHLTCMNFEARSFAVWLEEVPALLFLFFELDCVHIFFSSYENSKRKSRKSEDSRLG
jgi:hypothetical protein